jgi:adenylate cyclase class 2
MTQAPVTSRQNNLETEVKLICDNLDRIRDAGFDLVLLTERHFEDNWLLDLPDLSLRNQGAALRVRSVNGKGLITYKGVVYPSNGSPLKVREEIETEVDEPERVIELFEKLGYKRSFRYQKYRTVYGLTVDGQQLEVVFDETPMGNFVEIEGEASRVVRVLDAAGFAATESIRESYPELQAARCEARGVELEDLVFIR